ncbi:unnamed protein product [Amoebophrya sp. A120]|nr:unnamed protein product [Amoebophrya sp. A120]|eukprot:GSA120T00005821001.1
MAGVLDQGRRPAAAPSLASPAAASTGTAISFNRASMETELRLFCLDLVAGYRSDLQKQVTELQLWRAGLAKTGTSEGSLFRASDTDVDHPGADEAAGDDVTTEQRMKLTSGARTKYLFATEDPHNSSASKNGTSKTTSQMLSGDPSTCSDADEVRNYLQREQNAVEFRAVLRDLLPEECQSELRRAIHFLATGRDLDTLREDLALFEQRRQEDEKRLRSLEKRIAHALDHGFSSGEVQGSIGEDGEIEAASQETDTSTPGRAPPAMASKGKMSSKPGAKSNLTDHAGGEQLYQPALTPNKGGEDKDKANANPAAGAPGASSSTASGNKANKTVLIVPKQNTQNTLSPSAGGGANDGAVQSSGRINSKTLTLLQSSDHQAGAHGSSRSPSKTTRALSPRGSFNLGSSTSTSGLAEQAVGAAAPSPGHKPPRGMVEITRDIVVGTEPPKPTPTSTSEQTNQQAPSAPITFLEAQKMKAEARDRKREIDEVSNHVEQQLQRLCREFAQLQSSTTRMLDGLQTQIDQLAASFDTRDSETRSMFVRLQSHIDLLVQQPAFYGGVGKNRDGNEESVTPTEQIISSGAQMSSLNAEPGPAPPDFRDAIDLGGDEDEDHRGRNLQTVDVVREEANDGAPLERQFSEEQDHMHVGSEPVLWETRTEAMQRVRAQMEKIEARLSAAEKQIQERTLVMQSGLRTEYDRLRHAMLQQDGE